MPAAVLPAVTSRRAPMERGGFVPSAFWIVAAALAIGASLRLPLDGPTAVTIFTLVFLGGGLPHGAYDIALLKRASQMKNRTQVAAIAAYAAVVIAMAALWMALPLAALIVFLAVAAIHFGEDWTMLREPLLKVAAGAAILTAPAIGHPGDVARLFVAMGGVDGDMIARLLAAAAPMTLLVTAVGVVIAWQEGARPWAIAMAISLVLLIVLPPVAGFALFFVFLHSPRHLAESRTALGAMSRSRWLLTGAGMSAASVIGWIVLTQASPIAVASDWTAQAFQLLAAVAAPHLLLSTWLRRRCAAMEPVQGGIEQWICVT